ncbi:MAG: hypothetical protein AMXMBFR58_20100 [Phycisphaerae bacterium]
MSTRALHGVLAATGLVLTGCGLSFDVKLHNTTGEPVAFELQDQWTESSRGSWMSGTLASGGDLHYRMRDGWRSDAKYVVIWPEGAGPEAKAEHRISDSGTTELYLVEHAGKLVLEKR